jgi:hypothetical protein
VSSCFPAVSFLLVFSLDDNGVIGGLTGSEGFVDTFDHPSADTLALIVAIYESEYETNHSCSVPLCPDILVTCFVIHQSDASSEPVLRSLSEVSPVLV